MMVVFFFLFSGFLLGLELFVVLFANAQGRAWAPMMAATMPGCLASSSSDPWKKGLGVGVRGEDVELAD